MNTPKVSIIIPLYNRQALVPETLESIQKQRYPNWEAIIVDDGSSDQSYQVVEEWVKKDERFRLFRRNREPKGAPTCRNIGLEKSTGELIIYLDSDDLLAEHCLQQRVSAFQQHANYDFLVFPVQFFNNQPGDSSEVWLYETQEDGLSAFLLKAQWGTTSTIWKKEVLVQLDGFDERLVKLQDSDLHRRALLYGLDYKVFPNVVDAYHRQDVKHDSISGQKANLRAVRSNEYAFFKLHGLLRREGKVNTLRKEVLAGHLLSVVRDYILLDRKQEAFNVWEKAYEEDIVSRKQYRLTRWYIEYQMMASKKPNKLVRYIFRRLLPKYLLWHV